MEEIYNNVDHSDYSNQKCSHCRGNQVSSSKCIKVLLTVLSVSLVLALGGLCVLGIMYAGKFPGRDALTDQRHNVSKLQSDTEKLCPVSDGDKELLLKYKRFTKCLSSCTDPACKPCEDGWTAHHGKCYFFSSTKKTWFESRDSCVASGAHLVTINNKEVQDFLASKIDQTSWIGLNDLDTEGHWVWMNGQTLTETQLEFWFVKDSGEREPDNSGEEDCACMGYESYFLNSWFDASCNSKKKYICEKIFIYLQ
ncbi:CD209 antigen-like protein C isoform X1 [Chanodichthys erythropterus]|uniref:CD209 antigen-like protein C isoform X1 n=1 Tax=Chanodichthys erythropterus TaxID=933992 RepID=UPI00351DD371